MADLVDLDLNFVGGSAYDDDIGVWNGTGTCTTHHGESDCYADLYSLCVREATEGVVADYWPFTECMFSSQGELCADSWNGEDCGASAYNATLFDAVVSKCSAAAVGTRLFASVRTWISAESPVSSSSESPGTS